MRARTTPTPVSSQSWLIHGCNSFVHPYMTGGKSRQACKRGDHVTGVHGLRPEVIRVCRLPVPLYPPSAQPHVRIFAELQERGAVWRHRRLGGASGSSAICPGTYPALKSPASSAGPLTAAAAARVVRRAERSGADRCQVSAADGPALRTAQRCSRGTSMPVWVPG